MNVADIWDIFGGILLIALVATVLAKPKTAGVITATGSAFSGALRAAEAG